MSAPLTLTRRGRWVAFVTAAAYLGATLAATVAVTTHGLTTGSVQTTLAGVLIGIVLTVGVPVAAADRTWRTPTTKETR